MSVTDHAGRDRPQSLRVNIEGVPQSLRDFPQWVIWRYHWTGKAYTKQPLSVDGGPGSSTDASTWATFAQALDAYLDERGDGIGIVVTESDPIFAVDVDDATLEAAGPFLLDTYTERSPSGNGYRQFAFGHKPEGARSKASNPAPGVKAIELYDRWRFLTVTGHRVPGAPESVAGNLQPAIEALCARLWPAPEVSAASDVPGAGAIAPGAGSLPDDELVARIRRSSSRETFEALFDRGDFEDHSSADLSLCNLLAFWTGRDAGQIDRLFRQSALMRPKWDEHRGERRYGERTIDEAIRACRDCYEPLEHSPQWHGAPGTKGNLAIAMLEDCRRRGIPTPGIPDDVELPERIGVLYPHAELRGGRIVYSDGAESPIQPVDECWREPVDPFGEYVTPPFPLEALPDCVADFARQESAASGFDPGGYAFATFVALANMVDHRHRVRIGQIAAPAYVWGGIVGASGAGKSPVMKASAAPVSEYADELVRASHRARAQYLADVEAAGKAQASTLKQPTWVQRLAGDTTTEAIAQLCKDNPDGVFMFQDEFTELIGRMDAYSGKDGGKDRGAYLRAYDGGSATINRATKAPIYIEQYSVAILAGIQPEVLAAKFRQPGAGADGLYQRFMLYNLQPPGDVNYSAPPAERAAQAVRDLVEIMKPGPGRPPLTVNTHPEAIGIAERYHIDMRTIAQRTPARRFAEHLEKFPGFSHRVMFALHLIEAAATGGDPRKMISAATVGRALEIMRCLYRHSEAVYRTLDQGAGAVQTLAENAAEAILAKRWEHFTRGDLTRDATGWRGADNRDADGAIDLLIEIGWLRDVTPSAGAHRRGRKSLGRFTVNPAVHDRFCERAERIKRERADRYAALQAAAAAREN